jgi:hypothetical protein
MSFASPSFGPTQLSEVQVDADKPWEAFGITNLKELAAGMAMGDIVYFDGTVLAKITPGPIGTQLITHDVGNPPTWGYPP